MGAQLQRRSAVACRSSRWLLRSLGHGSGSPRPDLACCGRLRALMAAYGGGGADGASRSGSAPARVAPGPTGRSGHLCPGAGGETEAYGGGTSVITRGAASVGARWRWVLLVRTAVVRLRAGRAPLRALTAVPRGRRISATLGAGATSAPSLPRAEPTTTVGSVWTAGAWPGHDRRAGTTTR